MKPLINNQDHYNQTRGYFIDYINHLLTKNHIINKEFLREIQHDLIKTGYIKSKPKYKFFLRFLTSDKEHTDINISDYLHSLEVFKKQPIYTPTLKEFFIWIQPY